MEKIKLNELLLLYYSFIILLNKYIYIYILVHRIKKLVLKNNQNIKRKR